MSLGGRKSASWEAVVGYSLADLQGHLESLFAPGMSWENYGTVWHIDHRRPVASFVIESETCDGFRRCWALDNLQPLFALDNMRKGARPLKA